MTTTCRHFVLAKLRLTTSLACLQHSTNAIHVVFAISSGGLPGVGPSCPKTTPLRLVALEPAKLLANAFAHGFNVVV